MQQIKVITTFALMRELSDTIIKSLKPDNINFPEGLDMSMYIDDKLKIIFTCNANKIDSMISIIDEVLEHISTILNATGDNND